MCRAKVDGKKTRESHRSKLGNAYRVISLVRRDMFGWSVLTPTVVGLGRRASLGGYEAAVLRMNLDPLPDFPGGTGFCSPTSSALAAKKLVSS